MSEVIGILLIGLPYGIIASLGIFVFAECAVRFPNVAMFVVLVFLVFLLSLAAGIALS